MSEAATLEWDKSGVENMIAKGKLIVNTRVENTLYLADGVSTVYVYDLNGRLLNNVKGNIVTLDMNRLPAGCYIVKAATADGRTEVARVVKF